MSCPSQAHPPILTPISHSESTQTIRARHVFLPTEPPSYLSPAVRPFRGSLHVLTPPSNARTKGPFKPRSATKGTSSYQLRRFAEETLGSGSLRKAVKLPEGEDVNEWLAVNGMFGVSRFSREWATANRYWRGWRKVVDFYNQINLLYGSITEFCSPQSCPEMKATDECVLPTPTVVLSNIKQV